MKAVSGTWPAWQEPAMAVGVTTVAFIGFLMVDADRPWLLGALLLVAIVPWYINAVFEMTAALRDRERTGPPHECRTESRLVTELPFVLTVASAVVLHPLGQAVGVAGSDGDGQALILVLLIAVAELAASRSTVAWVSMALATIAIVIVASFVGPAYGSAAVWVGATAFTLLGGLMIRRLQRSMAELEAAHAALADRAAAEERQRIAREVHDVIAHSMTVTMLHLTAARMAVLRGDSDAAVEALEEAERAGRASLADIRTTVGLLRDDDGATAVAEPGATDIPALLDRYRSAGMRIDAEVDDRVEQVAPAVGLAVYRVVQEALANVAKHAAGAAAHVRIAATGAVEVEVIDDGPGSGVPADGAGHGLLGMRERVESLGGQVQAGACPSGRGWRIHVMIP